MTFDKATILRISKTIVLATQTRPVRSVYDDSGIVSHVVHTLRYKKPSFVKEDRFSKSLKQRLALEFKGEYARLEVTESLTLTYPPFSDDTSPVQSRYYSGIIVLTSTGVDQNFVFSLDPVGTLTVRHITKASYDYTVI